MRVCQFRHPGEGNAPIYRLFLDQATGVGDPAFCKQPEVPAWVCYILCRRGAIEPAPPASPICCAAVLLPPVGLAVGPRALGVTVRPGPLPPHHPGGLDDGETASL